MSAQKFEECTGCRWFLNKRRQNPICGECDRGEFYEEKVRSRQPTNDELMEMFGSMHDDD